VCSLASQWKLQGFVKNRVGSVLIEVEGEASSLDRFLIELTSGLPPLAQIDRFSWTQQSPRGDREFRIEASESDTGGPIFVSADVATCDDCLAELFNPHDRRRTFRSKQSLRTNEGTSCCVATLGCSAWPLALR
jgi:hydrogenase maturation protein HypF